jgi:hypothetical protein
MPKLTVPDGDPLHEVNHCHGPGKGHPCQPGGKAAPKLGKRATALLAQAERHPHGSVSVQFGHVGRRSYGARDLAAARELVKAGKLRFVKSDGASPEYRLRNFGRDAYSGRARISSTQVGVSYSHLFELVR